MSNQPELITITTTAGIEQLRGYLVDKDLVAYDIETTGLKQTDSIIGFSLCAEENKAFYVILSEWKNTGYPLSAEGSLEQVISPFAASGLIRDLTTKKLICHNGVFDCAMTEAFFKIRLIDALHTDTMVLAHLLNENRKVGLKELSKTYFGESSTYEQQEMKDSIVANGGEITKNNYELYKADSHLLAKYGAKDALLTYKLFFELVPDLMDQGLDTFFYDEESMPLLRGPTYQLNTAGLRVDQEALKTLKKKLQAECLEAKDFIYTEIDRHIKAKYPGTNSKNTFNMKSNPQMSWLLFGQLGLEFGTLTKEGKAVCKHLGGKLPYTFAAKRAFIADCQASVGMQYAGKKKIREPWSYIACDKKALIKHAPRYKWIEKLLEYNKNLKLLNTYIEGIEERMQYGVIRPSFLQHGTTSGRYASRNPNFQNLPRDDKRVKGCITPRPGRVFVGADYSQLEPRVFAYVSNDSGLLRAFASGDDFYSTIGIGTYQKTDCTASKEDLPDSFKVKYKSLRQDSKVFALATTYGATAKQLAGLLNKSVEDTQDIIDNYLNSFPGVRQLMADSHKTAKAKGQVTNLFGRTRRIPEATKIEKLYGKDTSHGELPYEARKLLNLATNHRIQSTAASIVNRSGIRYLELTKQASIDAPLVLQVHDSFIVECWEKDADDVAILLQEAMENTVQLDTIQLEAMPKIGKTLAEV